MRSVGLSGEEEAFSNPLFQTFGMFVGMLAALVMHSVVKFFKIPFPGYDHSDKTELPMWMYMLLAVPSLFDLVATALCMFGLRHVNVSVYQMLRGGAIIFVALLKQFMLGHPLSKFMWVGVAWNVVSIVLVGYTAMLGGSAAENAEEVAAGTVHVNHGFLGVVYILSGAFVQSLQYAFEEKVMSMDIAAPPLFLIGMEGLWGCIFCVFVLYPAAMMLPGDDHGMIENPYNTYEMVKNSSTIRSVFVVYFLSIFCYNILACLVTYMLNSVWHAILDNFRPITVWGTDLFIFYFIDVTLGEQWTSASYIQLLGMFVLLYGTAVYNAPNPGSILLRGKWYDCFLDFSDEYAELEEAMEEERLEDEAAAAAGDKAALLGGAAGSLASPMIMTPGGTMRKATVSVASPFRGSSSPFLSGTPNAQRRKYLMQQQQGHDAEMGAGRGGIAMADRNTTGYGSVNNN